MSGYTSDACGEFLGYSFFTFIAPFAVGMALELSIMMAAFCVKTVYLGGMCFIVPSKAVVMNVV